MIMRLMDVSLVIIVLDNKVIAIFDHKGEAGGANPFSGSRDNNWNVQGNNPDNNTMG